MLSRTLQRTLLRRSAIAAPRMTHLMKPIHYQQPMIFSLVQHRTYYKDNVLMPRDYGDGYMCDPVDAGERIVRVIALHDHVKDPSDI